MILNTNEYAGYDSLITFIKDRIDKSPYSMPEIPVKSDPDYNNQYYFPTHLSQILSFYNDFYFSISQYISENNIYPKTETSKPIFGEGNHSQGVYYLYGFGHMLSEYYIGNISSATKIFNELMDGIDLVRLVSIIQIPKHKVFYRARFRDPDVTNSDDMFHIPFELRGRVKTSRYSIPGLPALYLGSSSYVCWKELQEPLVKNLAFSKFHTLHPINLVCIQRFEDFLPELEELNNEERIFRLMTYMRLFPLMLACSMATKGPRDPFKPEYILPQLLLQYVRNHDDIDGIMFPSTQVEYSQLPEEQIYNYVFPVKFISGAGYCGRLAEMFSLTDPICFDDESEHSPEEALRSVETKLDSMELKRAPNRGFNILKACGRHKLNPLPGS
jgi:hypothetical protein